jgi:acyl dehydratase
VRTFTTLDEIAAAAGEELGASEWLEVTQERIDQFADATGDHQWIHVDTDRAKEGPFGTTIAHGFLTLSLIPQFNTQVFGLETPGAKLNYGLNKVRFPHPVPVGSRLRDRISLTAVTDLAGGKQITLKHVIEIEGIEKPASIAEMLVLLLP